MSKSAVSNSEGGAGPRSATSNSQAEMNKCQEQALAHLLGTFSKESEKSTKIKMEI